MERTGSHNVMVSLPPKTQLLSLARILDPVLLIYEPIAACWEVVASIVTISFRFKDGHSDDLLFGLVFFSLQWELAAGHLGDQYAVKEYNQHWWRGYPFPRQPVSSVLQDPSCACLLDSDWIERLPLPWNLVWNVLLEKREKTLFLHFITWALISGGIWASLKSFLYEGPMAVEEIPILGPE